MRGNLRLLSAQGIVRELHIGDFRTRYDAQLENYQHFICTRCHSILDLEIVEGWIRDRYIERKYKRSVFLHRVDFFGICYVCKRDSRESDYSTTINENGKKTRRKRS